MRIRTNFNDNVGKLHESIERGNHVNEVVYDVSEVTDLLQYTESEVLQSIPSADSPLRSYVEHKFPASVPISPSGSLPKEQVKVQVKAVEGFLTRLSRMSSLVFDLKVQTKPQGARFELIPPIGTHLLTTTDDRLSNLYRGEYQYEITKTGYKTLHGTVDFIDRSGSTLDCDLQPEVQKEVPLPCRLR